MENFSAFEQWHGSPERNVAIACIMKGETVAVLKNRNGSRLKARLPVIELANGERPETAVMRDLCDARVNGVRALASFDEIDVRSGRLTRYHVVPVNTNGDFRPHIGRGKFLWTQTDKLSALLTNSHVNVRTIRYLERFAANSYTVGH